MPWQEATSEGSLHGYTSRTLHVIRTKLGGMLKTTLKFQHIDRAIGLKQHRKVAKPVVQGQVLLLFQGGSSSGGSSFLGVKNLSKLIQ